VARFCPNCGTEVDDTAVFCPTCGQPIDQASEAEIPAAPAWPDPARPAEPKEASGSEALSDARADDEPVAAAPRSEDPTRVDAAPPPPMPPPMPPPSTAAPPRPGDAGPRPGARQVNLPVTWPVTMSAWLIGVGAAVGAIGVLIGLFRGVINPIDLLLLLLLLGIAVSVFFPTSVPAFPHVRLGTFVVALIAFGMALDRIGFGGAGVGELLLFLGAAAAGIGCILLELGRDQPLGGSA
jgi:zinc-ribbon domain